MLVIGRPKRFPKAAFAASLSHVTTPCRSVITLGTFTFASVSVSSIARRRPAITRCLPRPPSCPLLRQGSQVERDEVRQDGGPARGGDRYPPEPVARDPATC